MTVVGLGQTGGSIAARLMQKKLARITGYDQSAAVLRRARRMRLVHRATTRLQAALVDADLVILAIPVSSIVAALVDDGIPFSPHSLVMDVGSTKRLIMEAADRRRPPLRFIGGHPLAGNERRGLDGVDAQMFENAAFALIPGKHVRCGDLATARRLVRALGARPSRIDARAHDRLTGLTIGLPHVIAFLMREMYERERRRYDELEDLAGGSIWSIMRVSKSDPVMVGDFIQSNRDWVDYWWRRLVKPPGGGSGSKRGARRRKRGSSTGRP